MLIIQCDGDYDDHDDDLQTDKTKKDFLLKSDDADFFDD